MIKTCQECKKNFNADTQRRKFCSPACYYIKASRAPNKGTFCKTQEPWNKNLKGIHLSPDTEFQKGQRGIQWVPVGTVTIRTHKGKQRAWQKIAEPNIWQLRAIMVWESANGPLPKGKLIHHRDRDALNDVPDNLQCLTRAEHLTEHRHEFIKLSFTRQDRLVVKICSQCQSHFTGYVNARYCGPCMSKRKREAQQRYKQQLKKVAPESQRGAA